MTYPWPTLMPMGIVVISCVRPSVQPSMGLGLCIAYKALGRNVSRWLTLSIHGCLWILLLVCLSVHLSICSFTAFSGSHYWEMAVAITCGYGGYLLPLLAAHSSFFSYNWCLRHYVTGPMRWRSYWAGPARGVEHRSLDKGFCCFWGVIWRSRMARSSLA